MDPGRVWRGRKMPGHYGDEQVTVRNLRIISVNADKNLVVLKGAIPGPTGALVSIKQG
jgi:large subunit ribosomal protein L3